VLLKDKSIDPAFARETFLTARLRFKRQEFLWEYGFPRLTTRVNGPAVDEIERDCEHTVVPAQGLQVLEEEIFSDSAREPEEILAQLRATRALLADTNLAAAAWSDSSLLDAVRFEISRLTFIGTTSFDSPAALNSLPETRAALEGMGSALEGRFRNGRTSRKGGEELERFLALNRAAMEYLRSHPDFAAFDRAEFLPKRMDPLYGALAELQDSLAIPMPKEDRAYASEARSLFASGAWDLRFFAPPFSRHANSDQAALGRRLFFDPVLSGSGTRSCASCHQPERAFTDGLPKSLAVDGHSPVARNAPTLIHAAFQQGLFADLRAESLEDQASMVIHNPAEMGGDIDSAAGRLNRDAAYAARFLDAFADDTVYRDRDVPVTPLRIRRALAAYARTLISFESPWDGFVRGDDDALSPEARKGFNVFMGKAGCAACHFPPLFNGTRPAYFTKTDLEVLGVPGRLSKNMPAKAFPDADSGRMAQDHAPQSLRAFKTPTLRNVEFTGPYMHNGVFSTLEQVVDFYDAGGGAGMGLDVPNQTLSPDSLHLDAGEKSALVAFMKSLSDTSGLSARPSSPGRYAGDAVRTRKSKLSAAY
jgi:cytochrome c peroxidase